MSNDKKLIIIGGGEHACVIFDAAQSAGWTLVGYIDVRASVEMEKKTGVKYLGSDSEIKKLAENPDVKFIVGIGDNKLRFNIVNKVELNEDKWATICHPTAYISGKVELKAGTAVLAGASVGIGAKIGLHSLINTNSLVEHDCEIGNFSHLAPGTILGGGVKVGKNCLIGIGAKVRDHIIISDNCTVGTGAVVVSDVKANKTVVGIPAMPIREISAKSQISDLCVSPDTSLHDAMEVMAKTGQMIALVLNEQKLSGILTDGDVRKALLANAVMDEPVGRFMCQNFISVHESISSTSALEIMKANGIRHLPVVDDSGKLIDLHCLSGVAFGEVPQVDVIIMAGGKGTRLLPLTENLPKPMVRVAGKPILEHIILHLISCQIREFNFAVNHLSEQISDYFKDGSQYGCKINYLHEDEPLGTGGALKLLEQLESKPVLAMNGDLITQLDVEKMLKDHRSRGNSLTVGVRDYEVSIPYGVMKSDGFELTSVQEKPVEHYLINAGIYMIEPKLIDAVPDSVNYPMTELIEYCLKNKFKVGVYLVDGDWVDVGQHNDLKVARGL